MVALLPPIFSVRECVTQSLVIASFSVSAIGFVLEKVIPMIVSLKECM